MGRFSALKNPQRPWFGFVSKSFTRLGSLSAGTGSTSTVFITFKGRLGPVLRMAETPLFLLWSLVSFTHRAEEAQKDLLSIFVVRNSAKAGVRKRGSSKARCEMAIVGRVAIFKFQRL